MALTVNGTSGNDTITINGAGKPVVNGVVGGTSNTTFVINGLAGNDTITGGNGADTIFGGDDNDLLSGGNGNDYIYGNAGADTLRGQAGNDTLVGGAGVDALDGGAGNDRLVGGAGADGFTFAKADGGYNYASGTGNGVDQIIDFETGIDRISFSGFASTSDKALRFITVRDSAVSTNLKYLLVGTYADASHVSTADVTGATYYYAVAVGFKTGSTLASGTDYVFSSF